MWLISHFLLPHVTQADAVMAKFDGDGDGKLDYQVFYNLNIQDDQNIFFLFLLRGLFHIFDIFQEFKVLLRHKKAKNRSGSVHWLIRIQSFCPLHEIHLDLNFSHVFWKQETVHKKNSGDTVPGTVLGINNTKTTKTKWEINFMVVLWPIHQSVTLVLPTPMHIN